jgi:spore coat polysaccharide biosynthesis protein SpsF (cytidylyltransferase family)
MGNYSLVESEPLRSDERFHADAGFHAYVQRIEQMNSEVLTAKFLRQEDRGIRRSTRRAQVYNALHWLPERFFATREHVVFAKGMAQLTRPKA